MIKKIRREFSKPNLDFEKITRSSAYNRQFKLVPFGKIKGSVVFVERTSGCSFKNKLKRIGLRIHPCLTPRLKLNYLVL